MQGVEYTYPHDNFDEISERRRHKNIFTSAVIHKHRILFYHKARAAIIHYDGVGAVVFVDLEPEFRDRGGWVDSRIEHVSIRGKTLYCTDESEENLEIVCRGRGASSGRAKWSLSIRPEHGHCTTGIVGHDLIHNFFVSNFWVLKEIQRRYPLADEWP